MYTSKKCSHRTYCDSKPEDDVDSGHHLYHELPFKKSRTDGGRKGRRFQGSHIIRVEIQVYVGYK